MSVSVAGSVAVVGVSASVSVSDPAAGSIVSSAAPVIRRNARRGRVFSSTATSSSPSPSTRGAASVPVPRCSAVTATVAAGATWSYQLSGNAMTGISLTGQTAASSTTIVTDFCGVIYP